jgi:hypothetical protein
MRFPASEWRAYLEIIEPALRREKADTEAEA